MSVLGDSLDIDLRDRISNIHSNANALNTQGKQLTSRTQAMAKTSRQWSTMAENARGRLKVNFEFKIRWLKKPSANVDGGKQEVGDVQNWAEMIERDLLILEETLRIVNDDDVDAY